jgi:hypothetical protein
MRFIRNNIELEKRTLLAIDLSYGDIAELIAAASGTKSGVGDIVLRTHRAMVSLSNPPNMWDEMAMRHWTVKKLEKGESVTLVQE